MLFGYDIGVISGAENLLKSHFHLSAGTEELAVSAVRIGAIMGGILAGKLADAISRRYALLGLAILYSVGAVATAVAPSILLFDIGILFVRFRVQETKDRSLEDIDEYWRQGRRWPERSDAEAQPAAASS